MLLSRHIPASTPHNHHIRFNSFIPAKLAMITSRRRATPEAADSSPPTLTAPCLPLHLLTQVDDRGTYKNADVAMEDALAEEIRDARSDHVPLIQGRQGCTHEYMEYNTAVATSADDRNHSPDRIEQAVDKGDVPVTQNRAFPGVSSSFGPRGLSASEEPIGMTPEPIDSSLPEAADMLYLIQDGIDYTRTYYRKGENPRSTRKFLIRATTPSEILTTLQQAAQVDLVYLVWSTDVGECYNVDSRHPPDHDYPFATIAPPHWWAGLSAAQVKAGPLADKPSIRHAEATLRDKAKREAADARRKTPRSRAGLAMKEEREKLEEGLRRQNAELPMCKSDRDDRSRE
jgi:hypothetical protein